MELNEIWLWYVNEHVEPKNVNKPAQEFRATDVLERLWDFHSFFSPRFDLIKATKYDEAFIENADGALANLAMKNSMDDWETLNAGTLRVLSERLLYTETVLAVMMVKEPETITDGLPQGLSQIVQSRALLLKYLLGHARKIDRRVFPKETFEQSKEFPGGKGLHKH